MERFKNFAAPLAAVLLAFLIMFLLKSVPSSKLWKGYTTLSVSAAADGKLVEGLLREKNCGDFIALERQEKRFSEVYESAKRSYFFDRDGKFRIYYIPDSKSKEALSCAREIQSRLHFDALLGSKASFPYFSLIVCVLVFAAFFFFAENKSVFAAAALPALFFVFCNPFYAAAAAVCLELYALFLAQKLWRRKGAARCFLRNPFVVVFFGAAFLLSCVAGAAKALYFTLNVFCASSLLFLLLNIEVQSEKGARFLPVFIRSAKRMNVLCVKNVRKSSISALGVFSLFLFLLAGSDFVFEGGKKGLFFPAPTEYNGPSGDFPTMADYYAQEWAAASSPYRSLNKEFSLVPQDGETVQMTHYVKTPDGIKASERVALVYDKAFRKEAAARLDKLSYAPIERLWKAQGRNFSVKYASGAGESAGFGTAAALLFAMLPSLFAALYYIFELKRGRYVS
jgi:hypothetical protein